MSKNKAKDPVLSSTKLCHQLSSKEFETFVNEVQEHFKLIGSDSLSGMKVLRALEYHLYNHPKISQSQAQSFLSVIVLALESFSNASEDEFAKMSTAVMNITAKCFVSNFFMPEAEGLLTCFSRKAEELGQSNDAQFTLYFIRFLKTWASFRKNKELSKMAGAAWQESKVTKYAKVIPKIFYLFQTHLEMLIQALEITAKPFLVSEFIKEATDFVRFGFDNPSYQDNVLDLLTRIVPRLRKNHSKDCYAIFKALLELSGEVKCFSSWWLVLAQQNFDVCFDLGKEQEGLGCFDKVLKQLNKTPNVSEFPMNMARALASFFQFKVAYKDLFEECIKEREGYALMEDKTKRPDLTDNDCALDDGDVNPYSKILTIDAEKNLVQTVTEALDHLQQGLEQNDKTKIPTFCKTQSFMNVFWAIAEFLKLLGNDQLHLKALQALKDLSVELKQNVFKMLAVAGQVGAGDTSAIKELSELINEAKPDDPKTLVAICSLTWQMMRLGHTEKAFIMTVKALKWISTIPSTLTTYIVTAEFQLLLSLLRLKLKDVKHRCEEVDQEIADALEDTALDHSYEANITVSKLQDHLRKNLKFGSNSWLVDFLMYQHIHVQVLQTRVDLHLHCGLVKELRLYGRLLHEKTWLTALSTWNAWSLCLLAEIDLRCDDPDQADGKIFGLKLYLKQVLKAKSSERGKQSQARNPGGVLGSSPYVPSHEVDDIDFLNHVKSCSCHFCSSPRHTLLMVKYFMVLGMWHGAKNSPDLALGCFDQVQSLLQFLDHHFQSKSDDLILSLINSLLWQLEWLGQQDLTNKALALLSQVNQLMKELQPWHSTWLWHLRIRIADLTHHFQSLQEEGVYTLAKLKLLSISPTVPTSAKDFPATPTCPSQNDSNLPDKPTKRYLRPRRINKS